MLIDTHAHLYLDRFRDDEQAVIDRALAAGVTRILLPAIDAPSIDAALALCSRQRGICYAMAAIHPSSVKEATDADLDLVAQALSHPDVVAVGESGIDYYWDRSFDAKQEAFLRAHARLAIEHDLALVLHNRDKGKHETASETLVRVLRDEGAMAPAGRPLKGVFHCFGPPAWLAAAVMDLGFHVGIGGTATYKNSGVLDAVAEVPLERIILETDSPYLAPEPHRGGRNEPAFVRHVAEHVAAVRGVPLEKLAAETTAAACTLFGLPGSA